MSNTAKKFKIVNKWCRTCETVKPVSAFSPHKTSKDGLTYTCKECLAAAQRAYYKKKKIAEKVAREKRIATSAPAPASVAMPALPATKPIEEVMVDLLLENLGPVVEKAVAKVHTALQVALAEKANLEARLAKAENRLQQLRSIL